MNAAAKTDARGERLGILVGGTIAAALVLTLGLAGHYKAEKTKDLFAGSPMALPGTVRGTMTVGDGRIDAKGVNEAYGIVRGQDGQPWKVRMSGPLALTVIGEASSMFKERHELDVTVAVGTDSLVTGIVIHGRK